MEIHGHFHFESSEAREALRLKRLRPFAHLHMATPRNSPPNAAPSTPYTPSTGSRSPPRELPGDAGDTALGEAPGAGGMEVEGGASTVSKISDKLVAKFVEGDEESFGHMVSDVVE